MYPRMLERWYRLLKAAIMACDDRSWFQVLPFVLAGLRSVAAEKRDGPGETGFLRLLREAVVKLKLPRDLVVWTHLYQLSLVGRKTIAEPKYA